MTHFGFPYRIGADGITQSASEDRHVVHLIQQILFTRRGERRNRPEFGAGVHEMVFSENAPEIAAAARNMVQANLQQWLSPRLEIRAVSAEARDNLLVIAVQYRHTDQEDIRTVTVEQAL
ncbi:MAG: GPW/gp25 family protein [Pseudomonadota bacterium]